MDVETLRDQWDDNRDRPAWILNHREDLEEHIDTSEEIPAGGMHAVRSWTSRFASTVSRQLNEAVDTPDGDESAEDGDSGESAEGE